MPIHPEKMEIYEALKDCDLEKVYGLNDVMLTELAYAVSINCENICLKHHLEGDNEETVYDTFFSDVDNAMALLDAQAVPFAEIEKALVQQAIYPETVDMYFPQQEQSVDETILDQGQKLLYIRNIFVAVHYFWCRGDEESFRINGHDVLNDAVSKMKEIRDCAAELSQAAQAMSLSNLIFNAMGYNN